MPKTYRNFHFTACKLNTGFYVRSTGEFRLINNIAEPVKTADFPEIFWCLEGCGRFIHENTHYFLRPGQVWYYPPGSTHQISCCGKVFRYCWLAFDGPDASVLFDGLNIKSGINTAGSYPQHLFNKLTLNIEKISPEAQMENLAIGFQILLAAASRPEKKSDNVEQMQQVKNIIDENFSNPDLNVEMIASLLRIDRSSLSRKFSNTFNITIVEYLSNRRINEALHLLQHTQLPINKIAKLCGYSCHNYFTKVIRRHTGTPPNALREI